MGIGIPQFPWWVSFKDPYARRIPDEELGTDELFAQHQGYLDRAPYGIDARHAWTLGGEGRGVRVASFLTTGWISDHQDLESCDIRHWPIDPHPVRNGYVDLGGLNGGVRHGTAQLSIVCAPANDLGMVGIAPRVELVGVVSGYGTGIVRPVPLAIDAAVEHLSSGDVLYLPIGSGSDGLDLQCVVEPAWPCEARIKVREAMQRATSKGIIVVESAANGRSFLDDIHDELCEHWLRPGPDGGFLEERFDSGAILVAAGTCSPPHTPFETNYGWRVDCWAWGEKVAAASPTLSKSLTPDVPNDAEGVKRQYGWFRGTSAATGVIAGAVLCIQSAYVAWLEEPAMGALKQQLDPRIGPRTMRALLRDASLGTPWVPGSPEQEAAYGIRSMPDLGRIIPSVLVSAALFPEHLQGPDGPLPWPPAQPAFTQRVLERLREMPAERRAQVLGAVRALGERVQVIEELLPEIERAAREMPAPV